MAADLHELAVDRRVEKMPEGEHTDMIRRDLR